MTPRQVRAFVRRHGVVLEAAHGPVPSLAEEVAGGPISGSWWSHPAGHAIHAATRVAREDGDVLVCRLIEGRVTFVHCRLWAPLVAAAGRLPANRLARIREVHTPSGRHVVEEEPFPDWVPEAVAEEGARLSEDEARRRLGPWCP